MLISTLVTLMLLTGLTLTLQARTLAGTKIAKRLTAVQAEALARDAVRVLVRPVIGEAMIEADEKPAILLASELVSEFGGRYFEVQLDVIEPVDYMKKTNTQAHEIEVTIK